MAPRINSAFALDNAIFTSVFIIFLNFAGCGSAEFKIDKEGDLLGSLFVYFTEDLLLRDHEELY